MFALHVSSGKKKRKIGVMRLNIALPLTFLAAALCLAPAVSGQSKHVSDLGVGKLLVAPREAPDLTFAQTVILLVRFDADGTVGLVINHRSNVPMSRAFEQLKAADNRSDPVYLGGPVNLRAVFALLRAKNRPEDAPRVLGDVYLISTKPLLEKMLTSAAGPNDLHTFVGYCGWGAGQLQREMDLGVWYVFNGDAKLVFDVDPDTLWSRLIAHTEQIMVRATPPRW